MADVEHPKGPETFEEELEALGLPDEVKKKLREEDKDLIAGIRKCRHMADLLNVISSIEPDAPLTELEEKYSHFWEYVNAKARKGLDKVREVGDVAGKNRHRLDTLFKSRESDAFLQRKPTAMMAIKVRDLRKDYIDTTDIATGFKSNVKDQKNWVFEHEMDGFQLIFVLEGKKWELFDNTTGVDDKVVLEVLPQTELQNFWEAEHPVESRRETLKEEKPPEDLH